MTKHAMGVLLAIGSFSLILSGCSTEPSGTPDSQETRMPTPSASLIDVGKTDSQGIDLRAGMEDMGWNLDENFPIYTGMSEVETMFVELYEKGWEQEPGIESRDEYQITMLEERGYSDPETALSTGEEVCVIMLDGSLGEFADYLGGAFNEYHSTGSTDKVSAIEDAPAVVCPNMIDELSDSLDEIEIVIDNYLMSN